jgi:hypothetical protein
LIGCGGGASETPRDSPGSSELGVGEGEAARAEADSAKLARRHAAEIAIDRQPRLRISITP